MTGQNKFRKVGCSAREQADESRATTPAPPAPPPSPQQGRVRAGQPLHHWHFSCWRAGFCGGCSGSSETSSKQAAPGHHRSSWSGIRFAGHGCVRSNGRRCEPRSKASRSPSRRRPGDTAERIGQSGQRWAPITTVIGRTWHAALPGWPHRGLDLLWRATVMAPTSAGEPQRWRRRSSTSPSIGRFTSRRSESPPGISGQPAGRATTITSLVKFGVNRFVNAVEWTFDDGTSVVQRFEQRPEMQLTPVDATTTNVRMTILSTTRPPGADDDTVISEASFTGS